MARKTTTAKPKSPKAKPPVRSISENREEELRQRTDALLQEGGAGRMLLESSSALTDLLDKYIAISPTYTEWCAARDAFARVRAGQLESAAREEKIRGGVMTHTRGERTPFPEYSVFLERAESEFEDKNKKPKKLAYQLSPIEGLTADDTIRLLTGGLGLNDAAVHGHMLLMRYRLIEWNQRATENIATVVKAADSVKTYAGGKTVSERLPSIADNIERFAAANVDIISAADQLSFRTELARFREGNAGVTAWLTFARECLADIEAAKATSGAVAGAGTKKVAVALPQP